MHQYTYYRRYQPSKRRRRKKSSSFGPFFVLIFLIVICVFLARACTSFVSDMREENRDDLVLTVHHGEVELILAGQSDKQIAGDSQIVFEGDKVTTSSDSFATLTLQNGSRIILDENTRFSFSEVTIDGRDDLFVFELMDGRMWLDSFPKDDGDLELMIRTDVMNATILGGQFLVSNQADDEYVASILGTVGLEFVERDFTGDDQVIERVTLSDNLMSRLDDDAERALLARENIQFQEELGLFLFADTFYSWVSEEISLSEFIGEDFVDPNLEDEELVEEEAEDLEEEIVEEVIEEEPEEIEEEAEEEVIEEEEEADEPLVIEITLPSTGITIDDGAQAIEGRIVSGEADSVSMTWSGDGYAYNLGLFESGADSFRYVADIQYANLAEGSNTYTAVAYDEEGNASNSVSVVINYEFPQTETLEEAV